MEMVVTRTTRLIVLYDKDFRQRHPPEVGRSTCCEQGLSQAMYQTIKKCVGQSFSFAKFYAQFHKPHKNQIFSNRNKKTFGFKNFKPSIDNMIIILYFVQNLNIAKFGNIIYGR